MFVKTGKYVWDEGKVFSRNEVLLVFDLVQNFVVRLDPLGIAPAAKGTDQPQQAPFPTFVLIVFVENRLATLARPRT